MKDGASFESYVHFVYQSILNLRGERIQVSKNTKFRISERESYEIDIYYEFIHAGVRHRVAIECKDWNKPVDQGQVLLFHQKIKNIGDELVGVFISRKGYQSGAIEVGDRHGILMLKEQDLPTLGQLVGKRILAAFIPEENCVGEPFWYIAVLDQRDQAPDGDFYAFPESFPVKLPLFISKKHAEAYLGLLPDKNALKVYGMPQYKLRGFLAAALLRNMPIGLIIDPPDADGKLCLHPTDAESINRDFLMEPIVRPAEPKGLHRWVAMLRPNRS
ncbi:restriction endonuclease [Janthinobacterium sp. GB4P2]|uniref:restriction endonuclease n=1 Tax=Janthinobacterium sp. GB4P2 TaxID=3424189 RepID=UPI003F2891A3